MEGRMSADSVRREPGTTEPTPIATLRYGDKLGAYVVTGFAGKGATSYVYKARRVDGFQAVAIKVLHPHLVQDPINRLKFYREARVMMRMNHPNVVRFHEILEDGNGLAFVMEYVDGFTLEEWRQHHEGEVDELTLACVFVDILRGLANAHRQGVVHRDLKPANILITQVDDRYMAKVIDFGVARFVDEPLTAQERTKIVGTAAYISPEEVRDPELVCAASDLYSIGVMLYEAACGQRPFDNMAVGDLLKAHAAEDPERVGQVNPQLSRGMESVIMRTLSKNPDARFASAPEMINALELALQGIFEEQLEAAESLAETEVQERLKTNSESVQDWQACSFSAEGLNSIGGGDTVDRLSDEKLAVRSKKVSGGGFLRRCIERAFDLLASSGATGRPSDPHHLSRNNDFNVPFS